MITSVSPKRVLVACEYTATVRDAFRALGHDAWSCDFKPTEGDPKFHYEGDVFDIIQDGWDLMIAHPPCVYLAVSGNRWYANSMLREMAVDFVWNLWIQEIPQICIENPVGVLNSRLDELPKPQYVQPWQFGDPFQKKTGLWLKNLPPLEPTKIVEPGDFVIHGGKKIPKWYSNHKSLRDRTFPGIAQAMANQWG